MALLEPGEPAAERIKGQEHQQPYGVYARQAQAVIRGLVDWRTPECGPEVFRANAVEQIVPADHNVWAAFSIDDGQVSQLRFLSFDRLGFLKRVSRSENSVAEGRHHRIASYVH
jgi:hypothetical protein